MVCFKNRSRFYRGVVFWCRKLMPFELSGWTKVTKMPTWQNRAPHVFGNGTQASCRAPLNAPSKRGDCRRKYDLSPALVICKECIDLVPRTVRGKIGSTPFSLLWPVRVDNAQGMVCLYVTDFVRSFSTLRSTIRPNYRRSMFPDSRWSLADARDSGNFRRTPLVAWWHGHSPRLGSSHAVWLRRVPRRQREEYLCWE